MTKHARQAVTATAKAVLIGAMIGAVGFCAGMLVGFFSRPVQAEYIPEEQEITVSKTEVFEAALVEIEEPEEPAEPRYALTDDEREIVERVVMAEAEGEGFDGQRLVAQCILNTAEAMDLRPDEVVLAPNQYATPAQDASREVKDAVSAVFDDGNMVTDEPIQWFYAPRYVSSAWHESKVFVLEYGGHRFFKEG